MYTWYVSDCLSRVVYVQNCMLDFFLFGEMPRILEFLCLSLLQRKLFPWHILFSWFWKRGGILFQQLDSVVIWKIHSTRCNIHSPPLSLCLTFTFFYSVFGICIIKYAAWFFALFCNIEKLSGISKYSNKYIISEYF